MSLAEASAILPKYYEWQHWSRGDFSKEGLAAVTDGLISVGELKEPFDWNTLIDQSLLDEDLRRPLQILALRMSLSENRFPLFRDMR